MIQPNKSMKLLLQRHKINVDDVPAQKTSPIWKKRDLAGRPYWGVSDFWHLDQSGISAAEDLSQLEWEGKPFSQMVVIVSPRIAEQVEHMLKQMIRPLDDSE